MKRLLSTMLVAIALGMALALVACVGVQTQHQKIATACEASASAADAIASATLAGRVSKDQAREAVRIYKTTVPFCEPAPVETLGSVDYAALLSAAADLATTAERSK